MSVPENGRVSIPLGHTASVLDASLDPAVVVRLAHGDLTIIGCNVAFGDLVGLPMSDLMRRHVTTVFDEVVAATVTKLLESDTDSKPVRLFGTDDATTVNGTAVTLAAVCMERTDKHQVALLTASRIADASDGGLAVLEAVAEAILVTSTRGVLYAGNSAAARLIGRGPSSLPGTDLFELVRQKDRQRLSDALYGEIGDDLVVEIVRPDRSVRTAAISGRSHGRQIVLTMRDLTDQRAQEAELAELQAVDPLTGLANRTGLFDCIESIAAMEEAHELQVAFIDLDNFKTINDALGHDQGDLVLQTVAKRLTQALGEAGFVARLGGDEFVVVRRATPGTGTAGLADLLRLPFVDPIALGSSTFVVSSSAGIAVTADPAEMRSDHMLKCADLAMYEAKRRGKNTVAVYDESLSRRASERLDIESDLRRALENNEFELHYQPIMDVITGRPSGAEALIRWRHPERGMVRPDEFIPIAEQTGLIVPIGAWVLQTAVEQVTDWNRRKLARRTLAMSVNVSGLQLADPALERHVHAALSRAGLDPSRLTIEVTESTLMSDTEETMALLHRLAGLGVGIAIDDFGTGFSSLSYLKRLPARTLKIDKAFVDGLGSIPEDTALVTGIIGLASALDLALVAEGVETERQLKELRRLGCEYSQGYLHSKPLPAAEFEAWLAGTDGRPAGPKTEVVSHNGDHLPPLPDLPEAAAERTPETLADALGGTGPETSWHDEPPGIGLFDQDAS